MEEFLRRIKDKLSEEDITLICQVNINDEEYKHLIEISRNKINRLINSRTQTIAQTDEILVVALVQIAIREYNNGDYWGTLERVMGMSIPQQKKNYIGEIFNQTLNKYNLFKIEIKDRNKYVENIKAHSFVPNNYMEGYLDFLFSFYNKNLLRQLTDTLDEDLQDMINFISDNMLKDDIVDPTNTDSPKIYRLLKATKRVISQYGGSFVKNILKSHLSIIDSYYYREYLGLSSEDRFSKAICNWTDTRIDRNSPIRPKRNENSSYFGKPYFKIKNQQAYLVIPEQKIRGEINLTNLGKAIIRYGNNLQEERLEYYKAYGIIISEEKAIPITDLFCEYRINIVGTSKTHVIPSNEYRVFDAYFDEVSQMKKGDYYVLVKKGKADIIGNRSYVYKKTGGKSWDEFKFNGINNQTVLYLDSMPITENKGFEQSITFDNHFKQCKVFKEEKLIDVTQMHPTISFEINKLSIEKTLLLCNSTKVLVKDCKYEIENGDENRVKIAVHLHEFLPKEDDFYKICIDEPGNKIKSICDYLFLNSFECDIKDRVFIFEKKATFHINSDNDIKPLNFNKVDNGLFEIILTEADTRAEFLMDLKGNEYRFCIDISMFKYGFEKKWEIEKPEALLRKDLKNELWIMMPNATEASLQLNDNFNKLNGDKRGNFFIFDIFNIIKSIKNSSYTYNYIKLWYFDIEWKSILLFTVLNEIYISKFKLLREKKDVLLEIQVEGCTQLEVEIKDLQSGRIVDTFDLENGQKKLPKLSPNVGYKIGIFEKDEFGFGSAKQIGSKNFPIELFVLEKKTLLIKDIVMVDNGSKLPLSENYKIKSISSYFGRYEGEMTANAVLLSKKVEFSCTKEKDRAFIYDLQSFNQGQWRNLYYNKRERTIIRHSDCKFDKNNQLHKDFIELNQAFKFVITIKEI